MNYQLSAGFATTGFNFSNCVRNRDLINSGFQPAKAFSTGTTVVGIVFRHGIVLGADSRGTNETLITDKRSFKIHRITPNIFCCATGNAADALKICELAASQMRILHLLTARNVPVIAVVTVINHILYSFRGELSAAFIIGGSDSSGFHVYSTYPDGASAKLPYATHGSGSSVAMSIVEPKWYPNMTRLKAVRLVRDAIKVGIYNDLVSGGYVDMCVVTKTNADYVRHVLAHSPQCLLMRSHALYKRRRRTAKRNLQKYEISETVIKLE